MRGHVGLEYEWTESPTFAADVKTLVEFIRSSSASAFPPPNDKQQPYDIAKVRVESGGEAKADANFKEIMTKQGAAAQEQVKKQEEAKTKFEGMKAHFAAGNAILEQEQAARAELQKKK